MLQADRAWIGEHVRLISRSSRHQPRGAHGDCGLLTATAMIDAARMAEGVGSPVEEEQDERVE